MQAIIVTTDTELQAPYIWNTTPAPPEGQFRLDYKGFWNCDVHCLFQINGTTVICTASKQNASVSFASDLLERTWMTDQMMAKAEMVLANY